MVTVWHHEALCLVMPILIPRDRFFYPCQTVMIDLFSCIPSSFRCFWSLNCGKLTNIVILMRTIFCSCSYTQSAVQNRVVSTSFSAASGNKKVFEFLWLKNFNLPDCYSLTHFSGQFRLKLTVLNETTTWWNFDVSRNGCNLRMNFACTSPGWGNMGEIRISMPSKNLRFPYLVCKKFLSHPWVGSMGGINKKEKCQGHV